MANLMKWQYILSSNTTFCKGVPVNTYHDDTAWIMCKEKIIKRVWQHLFDTNLRLIFKTLASVIKFDICINTPRPWRNYRYFADIFKCIFLNEDVWLYWRIYAALGINESTYVHRYLTVFRFGQCCYYRAWYVGRIHIKDQMKRCIEFMWYLTQTFLHERWNVRVL